MGSGEGNKDWSLLNMTPCAFVNVYRRFGGTYCFHPRTQSSPCREELQFSTKGRYISYTRNHKASHPKGESNLHVHSCEKLFNSTCWGGQFNLTKGKYRGNGQSKKIRTFTVYNPHILVQGHLKEDGWEGISMWTARERWQTQKKFQPQKFRKEDHLRRIGKNRE
jgi:hypothetical protein